VLLDRVTLYNAGAGYVETRYWNGSSWLTFSALINGNLLVDGSVAARSLVVQSITTDRLQIGSVTANVAALGAGVNIGTPPTTGPFNRAPTNLIGITKQQGFILFTGRLSFSLTLSTAFAGTGIDMAVFFDISPDAAGDVTMGGESGRQVVYTDTSGPLKRAILSTSFAHIIPASAANGTYVLRASFQATGRNAAGAAVDFGSGSLNTAVFSFEANAVELKV
jgi:hypothetical protein